MKNVIKCPRILQVALPIINGAAASLLSTLVMALGNSYVFVSFYKTMILVFVLGVLHSIVFLPVLLSFVGPRRTSRPRTTAAAPAPSTNASRRYSVRGANCVAVVPPPPPLPPVEEAPGPSVELRALQGDPAASTAGSEGSHRTSLFAGERDSLSGHEGRPVVFVDRHANNETASVHSQSKPRPAVDRIEES